MVVSPTSVAVTGIAELLSYQKQIMDILKQIYEAFPSKVAGAWLVFSEDGFRYSGKQANIASPVTQSSAEVPSSSQAGGNLLAPPADPGVDDWEVV